MLDPISLMPVGNAYSLGSVDVFSTDTNSLTALPSNKNSSLSSEYKIGDPLTSIPLALDNNVFTPTNDTQRSDGSVKISKDKKDKNKEKNAYISPKLAEIFGDNETVRIKAGGREIKDSSKKTWVADTNFIDGKEFSTILPVGNTNDSNLFQSGRMGDHFSYQVYLPNGKYEINLNFVESPYITDKGQRLFDVTVEDKVELNNLDIWSEVGSQKALTKTIKVNLKDEFLDIDFDSVVGQALVSSIEIIPDKIKAKGNTKADILPTQPESGKMAQAAIAANEPSLLVANEALPHDHTNETFINAGGPQYTATDGHIWLADSSFTGGNTFATTQAISGTSDPALFQTERWGNFSYNIPVATAGTYQIELNFAEIYWNGTGLRVFDVKAEGQLILNNLDIWSEVGVNAALTKLIEIGVSDGVLNLEFITEIDNAKISSIHVFPSVNQTSDPFLHVVARVPTYAVDYEGNGSEVIALRGDESHTHEFGRELTGFTWKDGTNIIGTVANIAPTLNLGQHQISLAIADNNSPPRTLVDPAQLLNIYPINAVGGVLTKYFINSGITTLPEKPDFAEINPTLQINEVAGNLGTSSISGNVVVVMSGKFNVTTAATYNFSVGGGNASNIYIDGNLLTSTITLSSGTHTVEARIARLAAAVDPIAIFASINGGVFSLFNPANLAHDESTLKPFINTISETKGSTLGGQAVTIKGVAFFDGDASNLVKVKWGNTVLTKPNITVKQGEITLVTPPGNLGTVLVTVETPNGISEAVTYEYSGSAVPVTFNTSTVVANPFAPTQGEWGPDGRLYVASIDGKISIYTFDENYTVTNFQEITTIANLTNNNILGIAFNPFDNTSGSPKIYVAHSQLFANNGGQFINPTDFSTYSGQISVLQGPSFSTLTPLITGLPVSNHDHGINGLTFDNNGDLLIAVGSNTNAGIPANGLGGLPESPLSGAVLKAKLSDPNFQGNINYIETTTGNINNNQVSGGIVDVALGTGVTVFSSGLRNPFDVAYTTKDKIYSTVNGPNVGFGAASTSAITQGPDPNDPDELNLLVEGSYYGHPNRNRGRYDNRQNIYQGSSIGSTSDYTAPLTTFQPSTNGLTEYRADTFNGQQKSNLLAQKWNGPLYNIQLSADGTTVQNVTTVTNGPTALDVVAGPGGAVLGIDYTDNAITVSIPNISGVTNATAYDIFPWRAPAGGGGKFVIGGQNFGNLTNTTVTIGGVQAVLTSVSSKRIEGVIPAQGSAPTGMINVVVNSNGNTSTLANAFRYLTSPSTPSAGTFNFSSPSYTVNENGTAVSAVTITRTGGTNGAVSVTLTPSNGTAIASTDYNNNPITINFANGETTKTVTIPIIDDTAVESAETVNLTLSIINPMGGAAIGSQNKAILSILDNDSLAKVLINTGGNSYTDIAGQVWSADQYFTGSTSYSYTPTPLPTITGTNDPALYQNERSGNPFSYQIPVTNGTYLVNLNFAELYWNAAGKRIFNVNLEGQSFLQNFDIWSQAGGQNKALTKSNQVTVTDGVLNIDFTATIGNPEITSIELLKIANPIQPSQGTFNFSSPTYTVNENGTPVSAVTITRTGGTSGAVSVTLTPSNGTAIAPADYNSTPIVINFANGETTKTVTVPIIDDTTVESAETLNLTLSNSIGGALIGISNKAILSILDNDNLAKILINTGGNSYTDIAGQVWSTDQYFVGSTSYSYTPNPLPTITGTNDPALYQNERSGNPFSYQIPVTNGTYLVNLNFAELYWNAAGKRIFNVNLEGQSFLQNFDIWSQAGGQNKALTKSNQVTVTDGVLNIDFTATIDNPEITSIELLKVSNPSSGSAGTLAFSSPTYTVNENGTPVSVVTITRTGGSNDTVSVTVTPTNGTASSLDYNSAPQIITFGDGVTSKTVTIPIVDDTVIETTETINLTLTNPIGGAIIDGENTSVLSILDNDTPLRVQAESMSLSTYRVEANTSASGGQLISLKDGGTAETGFATYTFTGLAGKYDVVLGYYDEDETNTNGNATIEVKKENTVLDSWTLDLKLGSVDAVLQTFVRRKIATAISILPGDIFQLKGIESPGEKARIDYLEFISV